MCKLKYVYHKIIYLTAVKKKAEEGMNNKINGKRFSVILFDKIKLSYIRGVYFIKHSM